MQTSGTHTFSTYRRAARFRRAVSRGAAICNRKESSGGRYGRLQRRRQPDLVVANSTANTVSILLGSGNGTFATHVDYATDSTPQSVVVADFNGDGHLDLAVTNIGSNTISVFLGNGDGTFKPKVDYATGRGPKGIAAADFNGDGSPDI